MARPGAHPLPPDDLAHRRLPLRRTRRSWYRIHRIDREPLFFGSSGKYRFDAPAGEYGVLYVASDRHGAFIETFGHTTGVRVISMADLRARGLVHLQVRRPLRLVDLTGAGLARLGADERLGAGDYSIAQRWSLALLGHPEHPDGLCYRSRHDPSRLCAAIYQHAADALAATSLGSLADPKHASLLASLLDTYSFGLLDDTAD